MTAEIKTNTQEKFPELLGTYKGYAYACDFALLVYRSKHNTYKGIKVIGAAGPYSLNELKEDRFISDILTLSYTDPSKVKALFNFASKYNAIFLNINMPSKRIIKATKDLMDAFYYEGFGGFDTVASIEKLYRSNNITRPLMITDMGDGKQPNLSIYDIKKSAFEKIYVYDEADGLWYQAIITNIDETSRDVVGFRHLEKSKFTMEELVQKLSIKDKEKDPF